MLPAGRPPDEPPQGHPAQARLGAAVRADVGAGALSRRERAARPAGVLSQRLRDRAGGADLRPAAGAAPRSHTKRPFGHVGRGAISVAGMFLNFAALQRLPLSDATAISFAAPLITVAFAAMFLGERVRVYRWSAVAVGFVGVMVMLWPYFDVAHYAGPGAAAAHRRHLRDHRGLHQRRLGDPDPAAHHHRDDLLDRVLLLADLRGRRARHAAVRLGDAERTAACRADRARRAGRARARAADRELSSRAGLAGRAVRLLLDAVGLHSRLRHVRRDADDLRLRRRRHRGRPACS